MLEESSILKFLVSLFKYIGEGFFFIINKLFGIDIKNWLKKKIEHIIDFKSKIVNFWVFIFPIFSIIVYVCVLLLFKKYISVVEKAEIETGLMFLDGRHKLIFNITISLFVILFLWGVFVNRNYKKFRSMNKKKSRGYMYIGENEYKCTFISHKEINFSVIKQLITTKEKTEIKFRFLWSGGRMPAPKQEDIIITNLSIKDNENKKIPIQCILLPEYNRFDETIITIIPQNIIKKNTPVKIKIAWKKLIAEKRIKPYFFHYAGENKYLFHTEPSVKMIIQIPKNFIQTTGNNEVRYKYSKSKEPKRPERISSGEKDSNDYDSMEKNFIQTQNYYEIIETFSINSEGIFKLEPNYEYDIIWGWSEYFKEKENEEFGIR